MNYIRRESRSEKEGEKKWKKRRRLPRSLILKTEKIEELGGRDAALETKIKWMKKKIEYTN